MTAHVSAQLKVTGGGPPVCHALICTIKNSGSGRITPFGKVTFETHITADGNAAPCGPMSQWVRAIRTIHTNKGELVLHEAGLQCPQPGRGPRVNMVWALDGNDSTGMFAGAHGSGTDVAYPLKNTDTNHGTITATS